MNAMEYKSTLASLRVAIVHDWMVSLGGAERVVDSLLKLFPQADVYTSVYDPKKLTLFKDKPIRTTFLRHWPLAKRKHQLFSAIRPLAFESLDFKDYDLVISSSSAESKGVITPTETLHVSYIYTPTRYYWSGYEDYLDSPGFGILNPVVRLIMPRLVKKLRVWDYAAAQRPDYLVGISKTVAGRIKQYYGRESKVIYPPVSIDKFSNNSGNSDYFLVVARLVSYKRVDLAVRACTKLGKKLIVAGSGPELKNLKRIAGKNVEFILKPTDKEVAKLYARAKAFIFSANEDFGITPVEAMAAGCPVICYGKGGATETVIDGKTGVYHEKQTVSNLEEAIRKFEKTSFDKADLYARAREFSEERFLKQIGGYIVEKIKEK